MLCVFCSCDARGSWLLQAEYGWVIRGRLIPAFSVVTIRKLSVLGIRDSEARAAETGTETPEIAAQSTGSRCVKGSFALSSLRCSWHRAEWRCGMRSAP
jgi:hypothetical protein